MQPVEIEPAVHSAARPAGSLHRLRSYAWGVLAYNVVVIVWGALVRATGSGAGCGGHWPLCNGDVLPALPQAATAIEFVHRLMSGVALAAVVVLAVWVRRVHPAPSREAHHWGARRWASLALVFILTEALLGAGIVLLGYVAMDQSAGRAYWLCAHLMNTFLLLASLSMTAWTSGESATTPGAVRPRDARKRKWPLAGAIAALTTVAMAGVITALGDTLFPAESLARGFAQDFSSGAPFLIRLRVIHPVLAILTGSLIAALAIPEYRSRRTPHLGRLSGGLIVLVLAAIGAGILTLLLQAPVPMQLIHLLIADGLWIILVLFAYETLRTQ